MKRLISRYAIVWMTSISIGTTTVMTQPPLTAIAAKQTTTGAHTPSPSKPTSSFPYADYDKAGQVVGLFPTMKQAEQFLGPYPGGYVKLRTNGQTVYQMPDFTTVDLRYPAPSDVTAASINRFLLSHNSPLTGLGPTFMAAQRTYGVNATYLVAHAIEESAWGRSPMAISNDNLYGTGAFTANPKLAGRFASFEYAIRYQAWVVRKDYLNPGYSHYVAPTLAGMSANYASDDQWANNIRAVMNQLAVFLGDTVKDYRQYQPGSASPSPIVETEPTYKVHGALAKVLPDPYYAGAPVYATIGDGQLHEFSRTLQLGDTGDDVTTLQTVLNQRTGATLTTDGTFGSDTETALEAFQSTQGLSATGKCDFSLWTRALGISTPKTLVPGTAVSVDSMAQGMLGADVVSWFHVRGKGWVNARDLQLTTVYRVYAKWPRNPSDVSIPVYALGHSSIVIASLHSGDTIVCGLPGGSHGTIVIHIVDGAGKPIVGTLHATGIRLELEP